MIATLRVPDEKFLQVFQDEVEAAMKRVVEQGEAGENNFLTITQMFPHGEQDILAILYTKVARALGYEAACNLGKVREEAQDILNYAGFLLAYIECRAYQT